MPSERERKQQETASKPDPKRPSEEGKTRGASKQKSKQPRGGHPKQKTTHPVEKD